MTIWLLVVLLLALAPHARAVSPPLQSLCGGACSSNMVLNYQNPTLWGERGDDETFASSTTITVTVTTSTSTSTYSTTILDDNTWLITLPPQLPSTSNTIIITYGDNIDSNNNKNDDDSVSITLENVAFGNTFLCGGQSNMELELDQTDGSVLIENADFFSNSIRAMRVFHTSSPNDTLSALTMGHDWTGDPATNCTKGCGSLGWFTTTSQDPSLATFSAICYGAALTIFNKTNVPIGLVQAAWGGTRIEAWMSPSAVSSPSMCVDESVGTARCGPAFGGEDGDRRMNSTNSGNLCSANYNGMLHPLKFMQFDGMMWYQGESNLDTFQDSAMDGALNYACRFKEALQDWREIFKQALPFVYVELAACDNYPDEDISRALYPSARLAQRSILTLPNTSFVTAIDLGNADHGVHSLLKVELSERVGSAVISLIFDQTMPATSPAVVSTTLSSITFDANELFFNNTSFAEEGCSFERLPFEARYVGSLDFVMVNATIDNNDSSTVLLDVGEVDEIDDIEIEEIRFNFEGFPECALYSSKHIAPVAPFRMKLKNDSLCGGDEDTTQTLCNVDINGIQQCCNNEMETCYPTVGCIATPFR